MFQVYNDQTADGIWQSLVSAFRHKDDTDIVMSRLGPMHEMLHVGLSISNPRQRWVVSRSPGINPAFSLAEIIWIINGRHDSSFLNYFNRVLPRYAGCGLTYHGAYGYRLRRHFDVDQLERTYQVLRHQPDSRQAVLQIWDSRVDLPDPEGNPSSPDIPCNVVAFLKVRNGALEWTQIIRSNDLFRGLAYNIVQFTALQEIMAGWLGWAWAAIANLATVFISILMTVGTSVRHPRSNLPPTQTRLHFRKTNQSWFSKIWRDVQRK